MKIKNLSKFVNKISKYTPEHAPKKPVHQPSVKELNEVYKLDRKVMKIVVE